MVTKKKRRRQIASAAAQRQLDRRAHRAERNRRLKIGAWAAVVVLGVGGLSAWITTHQSAPTVTPLQDPAAELGLVTAAPTSLYSPSSLPSTSSTKKSTPTKKPTAKETKK